MDLSKAVTVQKKSVGTPQAAGTGLEYLRTGGGLTTAADRLARRVVALDGSGSMASSLIGVATDRSDIPDAAVATLRRYVADFHAGNSLILLEGCSEAMRGFLPTAVGFSDQDLAQAMVQEPQILAAIGMVPKSYNPGACVKGVLSIEFVRTMVEDRFSNNPADAMGVIEFTYVAKPMGVPGDRASILRALEGGLSGGGTHIANAMEASFEAIRSSPSVVGQNQIITVSDGQDNTFSLDTARDLFKRSRLFSVVFDFIYLVSPGDTRIGAKSLRWLAENSGGQYVEVWTREQYRTKFLEASRRKLLLLTGGH